MSDKLSLDFRPHRSTDQFDTKENNILEKNKHFYSYDKKYIDLLLNIINRHSDISIRVLDWFVANYSKKNDTHYKTKINGKEQIFYVHAEYKNQLSGYSKFYFDPFCRKRKIIYTYRSTNKNNDNIEFVSSIGQLNFFQWAIKYKIIDYVKNNLEKIEKDMKDTKKEISLLKKKQLLELEDSSEDEIILSDNNVFNDADDIVCVSAEFNSISITPTKSSTKSSNSNKKSKTRRHKLSNSVYEMGIRKSNIPIKLDFD